MTTGWIKGSACEVWLALHLHAVTWHTMTTQWQKYRGGIKYALFCGSTNMFIFLCCGRNRNQRQGQEIASHRNWFWCNTSCIYIYAVCLFYHQVISDLFIFFHLHLLYQPYLGLCQAPCVQSHQRQPMSAVAITACEFQVSAADSQTVPTVATGV